MDLVKHMLTKSLSKRLQRVLVVDPNPLAIKIVTDLMQDVGSAKVFKTDRPRLGLDIARHLNPQLIITEYAADGFDGLAFLRQIRRSSMRCRKVPFILTTADATVLSLRQALDVGVHEFLVKPFKAIDFYRHLQAAVLNERDWVDLDDYVGPDRRRFNAASYSGYLKRQFDQAPPSPQERIVEILTHMKATIERVEIEPSRSACDLLQQAERLSAIGLEISDFGIGQAAFELKTFVVASVKAGGLNKVNMRKHASNLMLAMSAIGMQTTQPNLGAAPLGQGAGSPMAFTARG